MKNLLWTIRAASGRNNKGRLTACRKGGGLKRSYRNVDFCRILFNIPAKILLIENDPFRSAKIALIVYRNGVISYILHTKGLNIGDTVMSSDIGFIYKTGDFIALRYLQIGTLVHNIELYPYTGGQLIRAAGVCAKIWRQTLFYTHLKLASGEERLIYNRCRASIGIVSNDKHKFKKFKKAGTLRNLGVRPTVRGIAMNPVDHPNGGRTKGGVPFTDRWGNLAKGGRCVKKINTLILKRRNL